MLQVERGKSKQFRYLEILIKYIYLLFKLGKNFSNMLISFLNSVIELHFCRKATRELLHVYFYLVPTTYHIALMNDINMDHLTLH